MRELLCGFGGHDEFDRYQIEFDRLYHGYNTDIVTPLGIHVRFHHYSCTHVCYGGTKADWYMRSGFYMSRAERIRWIEHALKSPSHIRPDKEHPERHKHLLYIRPDGEYKAEYYCVITTPKDGYDDVHEFTTAFDIEKAAFEAAQKIEPALYDRKHTKTK